MHLFTPPSDGIIVEHKKTVRILQELRAAQPRAAGGPVLAGRPYLVGERGKELFQPHTRAPEPDREVAGPTNNYNVTLVVNPARGEPMNRAQLWGRMAANSFEAELRRSHAVGLSGRPQRRKVG
jgi:hypothetical protein